MKPFFLCVLVLLLMIGAGCRKKPAYSDIEAKVTYEEKPAVGEGSDAGTTVDSSSPATTQSLSPLPPPTNAGSNTKVPTFVDTAKGAVKDLPNYPNARTRNVSYGPLQGQDTMSLILETHDPIEKVAAFYDKTVKDNKWTVVDRTVDPDLCEWLLKKGTSDNAKVQLKKDPSRPGMLFVVIARVQTPDQTQAPTAK